MTSSPVQPEFFAETALLIKMKGRLDPKREAAFLAAVRARAIYAAGSDVDRALTHSIEHPGYLHRQAAERDVFVPFNLASTFPGTDILEEAISIAEGVRLGDGHPICLSGSATFLGRLDRAADLDFCEYFQQGPAALPPAISSKAGVGGSPYLVAVKCNSTNIPMPSEALATRIEEIVGGDGAPAQPRIKLDFVGVSRMFGYVPVTNVVVTFAGSTFDEAAAAASFAFQEAVVCTSKPPRSLLAVSEFARYLLWLREESAYWLGDAHIGKTKAPLKSLKRALSALLLMGYDLPKDDADVSAENLGDTPMEEAPVDAILSLLNHDTLASIADELRLEEVRALATEAGGILPAKDIEALSDWGPLDEEIVQSGLDAARNLAEGLVILIDELFDRVEAGLA